MTACRRRALDGRRQGARRQVLGSGSSPQTEWVTRIIVRRIREPKPDFKKRQQVRQALCVREHQSYSEVQVKRELPDSEAAVLKKGRNMGP